MKEAAIKRGLLCLLTALLLTLPAGGLCQGGNYSLLDRSEAGQLYDVCPMDGGLALLGATGVWLYQPQTGEMTPLLKFSADLLENPIPTDERRLDHLFMQDGCLYVYDSLTPAFYRIEEHQAVPCLADAAAIYAYEDQGETQRKTFVSGVAAEDGLYLLLNSFTFADGEVYEMYRLDAATDEITPLGRQSLNVLYASAGGKLLAGQTAQDGQGQTLWLYEPTTGRLEPLNERVYSSAAVGFVWDEAAERLYYALDAGKVYAETADGQTENVAYLPYPYLYTSSRAFLWHDAYGYLQDGALIIRSLDSKPDERTTLKILGSVPSGIVQEYMAENPQVNIVFDARENSFNGLQEALLAGDSSVDLFLVTSDGIYTEVVEKGYAAPLTSAKALMENVSALYPWAQELLLQNGELYAVPVSVTCDYWTINRTKWQELGLGEYPQTYEDLFRIAEAWDEVYAEDYPDCYLFACMDEMPGMIRTAVRQYLLEHEDWSAPVDFDTKEFRGALQSILDHPDVFLLDGERIPLIMSYPQYLGTGYNDEDLVESFLPPALTADSPRVASATLELLMMNPASEHQAEAMNFLAFAMEHLDATTAYQLDATHTEPLRPDGYAAAMQRLTEQCQTLTAMLETVTDPAERHQLTDKLEALQREQERQASTWRFSPEDLEIYRAIAQAIVVPTKTVYPAGNSVEADTFDQAIEQFAAGSMPLERFLQTLNDKAYMMFQEGR